MYHKRPHGNDSEFHAEEYAKENGYSPKKFL